MAYSSGAVAGTKLQNQSIILSSMYISAHFRPVIYFSGKSLLRYLIVLFLTAGIFGVSGCHDEHLDEGVQSNAEINEIIYREMQEMYLWYDELPNRTSLDFNAEPDKFYYSLLVEKDGKNGTCYSLILPEGETLTGNGVYIFGMVYHTTNLVIKYIIHDSPAEKAGFQRGDVITAVNGKTVNPGNVADILGPCSGETWITVKRYSDTDKKPEILDLKITGREIIYDTPLHLDTVYAETGAGKVGYLFFHGEFAEGPDNDTSQYTDQLRQTFSRFHSKGVNQLIIDLRDNGGGSLHLCHILCTMLAPENAMGKLFLTKKYNNQNENIKLLFDPALIKNGARLDLEKLIIIVSQETASASELVIHCLKPYLGDKLIVVGTKTYGKNVGMDMIEDLDIPWILIPVTFCCENADGDSDYSDGLQPDIFIEENFSGKLYPYGDRREQLLQKALQSIGAE